MRPVLAPDVTRPARAQLLGGAPLRLLRLSDAGADALDAVLEGGSHPGAAALAQRLARDGLLLLPPGPSRRSDVTVVVPAHATADEVLTTLSGIPSGVHVVVVDDGSEVPLDGLLERPALTVLRHDAPTGAAAARNAGTAAVTTPLVAFVDAGVLLPDGWLDRLSGHLRGDVVGAAPRVVSAPSAGVADVLERDLCALDLGPDAALVRARGRVPYAPSTVLVVDVAALCHVGGFDPALTIGEDVDLVWRLAARGSVRYDPEVVVQHLPRPLWQALRRRAVYGTSVGPLSRRHPADMTHVRVSRWSLLTWAAALVHPAVGLATGAALAAAAPRRIAHLPPGHARRLAARAQWTGVLALARSAVRPGLPLTAAVLVASPRLRRTAPLLAVLYSVAAAPQVLRRPWRRAPARAALRVAEDLCYTAGAWTGCWRARTVRPLLPVVTR